MALRRTAENRPDLVARLLATRPADVAGQPADVAGQPADQGISISDRDREVLSEAGFPISSEDVAH
jgi:hypothetical protein